MAKFGGFSGRPGRYWIIKNFVDAQWFYWVGVTDPDTNANIYSHDKSKAAQFFSEQAANFAADMMGGPVRSRRTEEHIFADAHQY